jgi:hypothetical protein
MVYGGVTELGELEMYEVAQNEYNIAILVRLNAYATSISGSIV